LRRRSPPRFEGPGHTARGRSNRADQGSAGNQKSLSAGVGYPAAPSPRSQQCSVQHASSELDVNHYRRLVCVLLSWTQMTLGG
jgi:hypothetical protein